MAQLAGAVSRLNKNAAIQVTISRGEDARRWNLTFSDGGAKVVDGAREKPDFEIIVGEETWAQLSTGKVSPLEAFLGGGLRVRGDLTLARLAVRTLGRG